MDGHEAGTGGVANDARLYCPGSLLGLDRVVIGHSHHHHTGPKNTF
jgi:hypothetical protein